MMVIFNEHMDDSGLKSRMLETHLRVTSPLREGSEEEELTLLSGHTKVIVTRNNKTKSVLVGLQGLVKKFVGLGGWLWVFEFIVLITSAGIMDHEEARIKKVIRCLSTAVFGAKVLATFENGMMQSFIDARILSLEGETSYS